MKPNATHSLVHLCGLLSAIAYAFLALRSQGYASATLTDIWLSCGLAGVLSLALWNGLRITQQQPSVTTLMFWAVIFRLIGICAVPPLEDDYFRYLWDGRMMALSGDPYSLAPAAFFGADNLGERFDYILGLINYPQIATVYGPVCQWLFGLAYWIAPGQLWPLQLLLVLVDLVLIGLLFQKASPRNVLLYAWCPLAIFSTAFSAHTEVLGIMFMVAALLAVRASSLWLAGGLFALALGSKVFAILLLPWVLGARLKAWLAFFAVLTAITLSFGSVTPWLPPGLAAMAVDWVFNAPLIQSLLAMGISWWAARAIGIFLFGAVFLYLLRHLYRDRKTPSWPPGDLVFGAFLITAPVLNAWYWLWLLPFAVIYPSRWVWTGSVVVFLSYAIGLNLGSAELIPSWGSYAIPGWIMGLEFGLLAIAVLMDARADNLSYEKSPRTI